MTGHQQNHDWTEIPWPLSDVGDVRDCDVLGEERRRDGAGRRLPRRTNLLPLDFQDTLSDTRTFR